MQPPDEVEEKKPWKKYVPRNAREMASFKNKIPFSETMYEKIKVTIELLNERARTGNPLNQEQINTLRANTALIIEDAHKYGPPERPPRMEVPDSAAGSPSS
jgi:hypothetical protein